jgi:hypothetical protein
MGLKTGKIEVKFTEAQKNIIRRISEDQGISMTDYIMHGLFMQLDKDGLLLKFLNNDDK